MAGIGTAPMGTSPLGIGTPISAAAPPDDPPDRARFIEPSAKQHELAEDGEYKRMPNLRQKVLLALTTTLGSATAAPEFGLKRERKIDESFVQRQEQRVREALSHIPATEMRLRSVVVRLVPPTGRSEITVGYDDIAAGRSNQVLSV